MDNVKKAILTIGIISSLIWPPFLSAGSDPLKSCAQELADGLSQRKNIRVAVLAIPYFDNHSSEASFIVSDLLTTYLAKDKRLVVLERDQIVQALKEIHLSETGVFASNGVKRLGEMLGADAIVTGTLIDIDGHKTEINVRSVLSENGRIISASRALLERSWDTRSVLQW